MLVASQQFEVSQLVTGMYLPGVSQWRLVLQSGWDEMDGLQQSDEVSPGEMNSFG